MTSFKVSAPGKVILFGEHSAVYGKTAVAASLNQRTILDFNELPPDAVDILMVMPRVGISKMVPVSQVQQCLLDPDFPKLGKDGHEKFYNGIREFVDKIGHGDARQRSSLESFFYALVQTAQEDGLRLKPFKVHVDTELPVGAGAGSSASYAVSVTAGLLHWSRLQSDAAGTPASFDSASLEKICRYAYNCERITHGTPSGVDNSICTFGSVIEFRKNEPSKFFSVSPKGLRILLVDTKVERSTKLLVHKVAGLVVKYPQIFHQVLEAMHELAKHAVGIIERMQSMSEDANCELAEAYKDLSELIDTNQGLLATCQVSHSSLDLICMIAKENGFPAKLTGAGGGGFAYVLIPPNTSNTEVQKLSSELIKNKFSVTETTLGGSGVEIL